MLPKLTPYSLLSELTSFLSRDILLVAKLRSRLTQTPIAYLSETALSLLPFLLHNLVVKIALFWRHFTHVSWLLLTI